VLYGEPIEGQVDDEQGESEVRAGGVVDQEGDADRTAGVLPGALEEADAKRDDTVAGEDALDVVETGMPRELRQPISSAV